MLNPSVLDAFRFAGIEHPSALGVLWLTLGARIMGSGDARLTA